MKKTFQTDLVSLTTRLVKHTKSVKAGYDPDAIHELRTNFKKLRALLRWQKVNNKVYESFRKIYHAAGDLRNIQVLQEIFKNEKNELQPFMNWLETNLQQLKEKWNKTGKKQILANLQDDIGKIKTAPKKNKRFFSSRLKKIEQILSIDPVADIDLHEIRKMVKDMQYVLEWWKRKAGKPKQLIKNISINKLKNTGKLIGEYNDKRISLVFLTAYAQQEKDALIISAINPVIDKWQDIKTSEKEKLIAILHYEMST